MSNLSRTQNLIYGLGLAMGLLNKMRHGAATFEFVGIEHFDETFEIIKAIAENNVYSRPVDTTEHDLAQLMEAATALITIVDFNSIDPYYDVRHLDEWRALKKAVAAVELIKDAGEETK
jgi:hypothetical protein